jgi:hypothetical protein
MFARSHFLYGKHLVEDLINYGRFVRRDLFFGNQIQAPGKDNWRHHPMLGSELAVQYFFEKYQRAAPPCPPWPEAELVEPTPCARPDRVPACPITASK